jgi:hypothetical protein
MGGSEDESRVSAVGSDASSMLSPELAKRSSRKKCNRKSIRIDRIRTGNGSSIRTRRTSEIQIEHQTELSQDETDLARGSFAKMRQKFNAAPRCSAAEHALECATQEARVRKIRSLRLKSRVATFYGCVPERFAGS